MAYTLHRMKISFFLLLLGLFIAVSVLSFIVPLRKRNPSITSGSSVTVSTSSTPLPAPTSVASVPLPTGQDVIRTFFERINEKRIPEAISMMDASMVPDDSAKQAYGVTFNAFSSLRVTKIAPSMQDQWIPGTETYRVDMDVGIKPDAQGTLWSNGPDTKWVTVQKQGDRFMIHEIATGP